MRFTRVTLATVVALLLLLPACGLHYKRNQLTQLDNSRRLIEVKNDISVHAHHMNRTEIQDTFGIRGRKLGYYHLCPIQLHIKNASVDAYTFDPSKTTITYANHADVAYCLQNNTVRNTTVIAALGLAATGIACIYTLPFALWFYLTGIGTAGLYLGLTSVAGMLILTPTVSVYYAKNASKANQEIARDVKEITGSHTRTIPAGQELDVILFTKKENSKKDFSLSLVNEATQEITRFNFIH